MADAGIQSNRTKFAFICVTQVVGGVPCTLCCIVAAPTIHDGNENSTTVVSPAQPSYDPQNVEYCGRIVCKIDAMVLDVVLYYARGEANPNAATNIVEFQQQQE